MRTTRRAVLGFLTGAACAPAACSHPQRRFQFSETHMGVRVTITLLAPGSKEAEAAARLGFARIAALDRAFSDYRTDSELAFVNAHAADEPVVVSADFFQVLEEALSIARTTGGAFDPAAGNLFRVWRQARRRSELPSAQKIEWARQRSGFQNVILDPERETVRFAVPQLRLDFGGIAKGFAAQQAVHVLRRQGAERCLVAVAGDIAVGDAPLGPDEWCVRIDPFLRREGPTVSLVRQSISTSSPAEQFVTLGGKRYSHILDPRTGFALEQDLGVTAIAPCGLVSDAWATAFSVLGPNEGRSRATGPSLTVMFFQPDNPHPKYTLSDPSAPKLNYCDAA